MQKKRIQKALVMLLAVVMILGMQPATVHAVDLAEEPTNEQQASTTAEPEDKETALPENEPDGGQRGRSAGERIRCRSNDGGTHGGTGGQRDCSAGERTRCRSNGGGTHGGTGGQRDRSAGERTRCRSIGGSPR